MGLNLAGSCSSLDRLLVITMTLKLIKYNTHLLRTGKKEKKEPKPLSLTLFRNNETQLLTSDMPLKDISLH